MYALKIRLFAKMTGKRNVRTKPKTLGSYDVSNCLGFPKELLLIEIKLAE